MERYRWLTGSAGKVFGWWGLLAAAVSTPVVGQDNPLPLNWRNLTVQVYEVYGNNQTRVLAGAKVVVSLKEPRRLANLQSRYPTLQFPQKRTTGTRGATFGKLPPSSQIGPYQVEVIPKPNNAVANERCQPYGTDSRIEVLMPGNADQRRTFRFRCSGLAVAQEFARRAAGGQDLVVQVKQSRGTRGIGLWVHLYDAENKLVKRVRTDGNAVARFKALDPADGPYKVEVRNRFGRPEKVIENVKIEKIDGSLSVQLD